MAPALRLIGGSGDLADLPQRLQDEGIDVRLPEVIQDADYVAFCISCTDGPTPATSQAVELCAGRTVAAVAIVLTNYALLDDDSLRELVTVEERAAVPDTSGTDCRASPCLLRL